MTMPRRATGWCRSARCRIRDPATGSWAAVDYDGLTASAFAVTQAGSRQLWDEITAAYRHWEELGRPSVGRYGLTVTSGGTAVWVDSPAIVVAAR
ncbi:hypothetical protein ACGFNX_33860 [Streptomyces sp. NPDC048723]|uniref:hypothetical protein n=1 Tax=Streptomyces sp. NPDC048723 TaxID=3365589 RepID=UPI0037105D06